jgi:riboflavin kinase/FMN adenylyltransferase
VSRIIRYTTLDTCHLGDAAVALGVFDGVHIGHQALIGDMVAAAHAAGHGSCVVTFDRDPDQVITPLVAAPQLTTLEDKLDLIAELGPDTVLVVPFDTRLASLQPRTFIDDVLLRVLRPRLVVVGENFRFGVRASGTVETLRSIGRVDGFQVTAHELVSVDRLPVTSTRIRALVASGGVRAAATLLGRPHRLRGRVVHGEARGRALGAPTANLSFDPLMALPGEGIYAGRAVLQGRAYAAAVSVGRSPTFGSDATADFEAHLLDFDGDLYEATLTVEFLERLDGHRAYADTRQLADAIARYVEQVRAIVRI